MPDIDRVKWFQLPNEVLIQILAHNDDAARVDVLRGMPDDVTVLGIYYDPQYRAFKVFICSDEFDLVHQNAPVPEIEIKWREPTHV